MRMLFSISALALLASAAGENMNDREYLIANGDARSSTSYSTELETEFFEVYSPLIRTRYSEVFWVMQEPVPLPPTIVERFREKVIAIRGYEIDQVRTLEDGTDVSVPITQAYNHHYGAFLVHKDDKIDQELKENHRNHSYQWPSDLKYSHHEFFSEGNGGEFRSSYHGYPKGYAQLLESPDHLYVNPMQIDTWNRSMGEATTLYHPGPLPKSSRIPHSAGYSGLIECPCNDEMVESKTWDMTYSTTDCQGGPIANVSECLKAAQLVVPSSEYNVKEQNKVGDAKNCTIVQHRDGSVDVLWNGDSSVVEDNDSVVGFTSIVQVNVTVTLDTTQATIRITGPTDLWFGVGFGANTMCLNQQSDECPQGGPYAIIVTEDQVMERKLDQHGPGKELASSVTIQSNTVTGENRTVILTRSLQGLTDEYYSFDKRKQAIDMIAARGCGLDFAQHCGHGSSSLFFVRLDKETLLCRAGIQGTLGGNAFDNNRCADTPISDLKRQNNPTCQVQTYMGGLSCCRHLKPLLDTDKDVPWPDEYLEYRFKFRFYFEDFQPPTKTAVASHHHLTRVYWMTESFAGEYDIPQCDPSTPPDQCVHVITSQFKVKDAVWGDTSDAAGIKLIYAGPHCHAPTCLSMDLYNADTGEMLCHVEPLHGKSGELYDEVGFLAIPPCLWGSPNEGLVEPKFLSLDTTLMSVKRNNNTLPHTGEMASWQMRAVVIPKEEAMLEEVLDTESVERTSVSSGESMLRPIEPIQ